MRITKTLLLFALAAIVVVMGGLTASAQTASDYRFLDVVDTVGKPVAEAEVETIGSGTQQTTETDKQGAARVMIVYGDYTTRAVRISKPGYETEEIPVSYHRDRTLMDDELPPYDAHRPIRVVLLRQPTRDDTRDPDKAERLRRRLVFAVKNNWASMVTELIHAGVSPDTTDQDGIPIIIWASTSKYLDVLRVLLAVGADVKNRDGLGRKALLYYLIVHFYDPDLDLVRELIKAGADLNATNRREITPLSAAEYTKNAKLIELLKKAGATAR